MRCDGGFNIKVKMRTPTKCDFNANATFSMGDHMKSNMGSIGKHGYVAIRMGMHGYLYAWTFMDMH